MNWDQIQGDWKQFGGKAKEEWGKLTDDLLMQIGGRRDQLIGKVQEAYGTTKEEAERQVKAWTSSLERHNWSQDAQRGSGGGMNTSSGNTGASGGNMGSNNNSGSRYDQDNARSNTGRWVEDAKRDVEQRVEAVSTRVQEQPVASLAVAAGVGFVIGVLLSR